MSTTASTSLEIRTTADARILQRIVSVMGGRGCKILKLDFVVGADSATMVVDVDGPPQLVRTAVARIAQLPHVLELLPDHTDRAPLSDPDGLELTKLRVEARRADGRRSVCATVGLSLDDDHVLVAQEGVGTVDAVAAAVQEGVSRLRPGQGRLEVADVRIDVWEGGTTAPVAVRIVARSHDRTLRQRGVASDVGTAAAYALIKLHAQAMSIGQDVTRLAQTRPRRTC